MKTLIYFSPFPPQKSGVADYSEVLVEALSRYFAITLAVAPINLAHPERYRTEGKTSLADAHAGLRKKYPVKVVGTDEINFLEYDYRIYNVGNNPHFHAYMYDYVLTYPGLVILHDCVLYFLTVGKYWGNPFRFFTKMWSIGGWKALYLEVSLLSRCTHPLSCPADKVLPLNKEIVQSKNQFMVHSKYAHKQLLNIAAQKKADFHVINHISAPSKQNEATAKEMRDKYGIGEDEILISSFGQIAPTKLNHVICRVIRKLAVKIPTIRYLMVGEGGYADQFIDGRLIRKTGFVNMKAFVGLIKASDIVVNLRNPSMGETSGAVIFALREGRPCIVSDDAWFSELPDNSAIKISNQNVEVELEGSLRRLIASPQEAVELGFNGRALIEADHSPDSIAREIADIILRGKPIEPLL